MPDDPWDAIHPRPVILVDAIGVIYTPKKSRILRKVTYDVPMFVRQWLFDVTSYYYVYLLVDSDKMKAGLQRSQRPALFFTDFLVAKNQAELKNWMTMFRGCLVISNLPKKWGVCVNGVNTYDDPEDAIKKADQLATIKGADVFMLQMRAIKG